VKRIVALVLAICLFSLLLAHRHPSPSGAMLSFADQKAVLAFSETETDNLMKGMNAGDYAIFSRDFSPDMLEAIPQSKFIPWQKEREAKLGWYLRRELEGMVRRSDGTYTVIYQASFQFNDDVLMRVVFRAEPPHEISGLSFDK
jgi:hypothetical protein